LEVEQYSLYAAVELGMFEEAADLRAGKEKQIGPVVTRAEHRQ
jgi:hypothetical protein